MPSRIVDAQQERAKRELRLRIARLRLRIDRRVRRAGDDVRRLGSWRSCVQGYPGCAIVAALGAGLALSAGLSAGRISRWLGLRLIRRAADTAGRQFWQELKQLWADSTPDKPAKAAAQTTGACDDRA